MQRFPGQRLRYAVASFVGVGLLLLVAFWFRTAGNSSVLETHLATPNRLSKLPSTILWAWERPEKLDYIDQQKVGVAFLAKTIYLRGDQAVSLPRLQPLALPAGVPVIAVARIETERARPATLSSQQMNNAAREIADLGRFPNVVMVQVDFDATLSERSFYRSLLTELRGIVPQPTLLSITALASWCSGDNWLDDLPIDEAVPMLFRMGVERNQFRAQLAAGQKFNAQRCSGSVGISTDEPLGKLPQVQRVYVFNPVSWTPAQVSQVMTSNAR
jgi:hypothetical protein